MSLPEDKQRILHERALERTRQIAERKRAAEQTEKAAAEALRRQRAEAEQQQRAKANAFFLLAFSTSLPHDDKRSLSYVLDQALREMNLTPEVVSVRLRVATPGQATHSDYSDRYFVQNEDLYRSHYIKRGTKRIGGTGLLCLTWGVGYRPAIALTFQSLAAALKLLL